MNNAVTHENTSRSVFISHASNNFKIADEIRDVLETRGVSCWIAPRDIPPGQQYGTSIIEGISNSSVFLLLLTDESNLSVAVQNEVERAFGYQKTIIPVRISDVKPGKEIEFFVCNAQWVDAIYQPLKRRMEEVAAIVQAIEMSAKIPPVRPEKKTVFGQVEKFFERALRHKTISFVSAFSVIAMLIVIGIYFQTQSVGTIEKASNTIERSGADISVAASSIKDSSEKVSVIGGKMDGLKKETSDDPKKELANLGLMWDESVMMDSLHDPIITNLFIQGGMRLSRRLVLSNLAFGGLDSDVLNLLMPDSGIKIYGDCPVESYAVIIPRVFEHKDRAKVFNALCNINGELTKIYKEKIDALDKAGHDPVMKDISDASMQSVRNEIEFQAAKEMYDFLKI